jgi:hypothetical protein
MQGRKGIQTKIMLQEINETIFLHYSLFKDPLP